MPYWQCGACPHQTSLISGTIFEARKLPLCRWFLAMQLLTQSKNNVSALVLARHHGVSYRSAWLLEHRIVQAIRLAEQDQEINERVEIDAVYLSGGKAISGSYHAFDFTKDAHRVLAEFPVPLQPPLRHENPPVSIAQRPRRRAPSCERPVRVAGVPCQSGHAMTLLVAGGAGFIGPSLVERAARDGYDCVVVDNLSRGRREHLSVSTPLIEADLAQASTVDRVARALAGRRIDELWHLAANSDIPAGVEDPSVDLRDTFLTTFHLLALARRLGVRRFFFASSSAVYGDQGSTRIAEDLGPLLPISNYGAMKLASEAQISAAAESLLDCAGLYRFPNVVGVPATHGVLLDFVRKLKVDPTRLDVLGDGTQQKAYLHASELVDAMWFASRRQQSRREVLNIGPIDDGVTVRWIAERVRARVAPQARIVFGRGNKGWVGDVPRFRYDTSRLSAIGWRPTLDSQAATMRAIEEIACQEGL